MIGNQSSGQEIFNKTKHAEIFDVLYLSSFWQNLRIYPKFPKQSFSYNIKLMNGNDTHKAGGV